jgi:outer membrane protein assembly factor BamB
VSSKSPGRLVDGASRRGRRRVRLTAVAAAAGLLSACGSGRTAPITSAPTTSAVASPGGATTPAGAASTPGRSTSPAAAAADWPTYDRTGSRPGLSVSTPTFTSSSQVVKAWTAGVDGAVYGQPLVIGTEVVVATQNDSVYAFNASTGHREWRRHLAAPVPSGLPCGDIDPSGITGTPVADVATGRLWVVTFSPDPYRHLLWSLDLDTGAVVSERGADGPGSDARAEQERGALALTAGEVYIPYGGLYGDCSDYHGWVVGAPTSGPGPLVTYVTPTQREAGIWSPPGASFGAGSLYVSTGNGTPFTAVDNSDSVVRLRLPGLAVQGTFTPSNFAELSADDQDLSSTSPVLLPDHLVFQIGKQGVAYVLDALHLGGVGGQLAARPVCPGGFGGAAADGLMVVVSCYDGLYAVAVTPPAGPAQAGLRPLWSVTGFGAGPPIIAGGVVWDVSRGGQLAGYRQRDGRRVYSTGTAPVVTSFPSLSASGNRLFVPEGHEVVSYRGI